VNKIVRHNIHRLLGPLDYVWIGIGHRNPSQPCVVIVWSQPCLIVYNNVLVRSLRENVQQTLANAVGTQSEQKNSPQQSQTFSVLKGCTVWHLSQKSMSMQAAGEVLEVVSLI
jgi:hypothetical protein